MARVPTVIALIKDDHLAIVQEVAPERKIGVDGKAVAMRENQSRPAGISMPANTDDRAVGHGQVENGDRLRKKNPTDDILSRLFGGARKSIIWSDIGLGKLAVQSIHLDGCAASLPGRAVTSGARRLDDDRLAPRGPARPRASSAARGLAVGATCRKRPGAPLPPPNTPHGSVRRSLDGAIERAVMPDRADRAAQSHAAAKAARPARNPRSGCSFRPAADIPSRSLPPASWTCW